MGKLFLCLIVLFSLFSKTDGQTVDLRFQEFELNKQLSSASLTAVTQDMYGFMWLGTNSGLYRFDGYEMKKYLGSEGMNAGITEDYIYKLHTDLHGKLWILLNSSLCCYNYRTDFIEIVSDQANMAGLSHTFITDFAENSDSVLFVSDKNTIYRFNADSSTFKALFTITTGEISGFCFSNTDCIWIAYSNIAGLSCYNIKSNETTNFDLPQIKQQNYTTSDLLFYNDQIWMATMGAGIISYDPDKHTLKQYPTVHNDELSVKKIYVDKDYHLWQIDVTGLKLYVNDRDFFQVYSHDNSFDYSIPSNVYNIFQDTQKNYWTLHTPGGVGFSPQAMGFTRFDSKNLPPFQLTNDNISAICEDSQGNLWLGNAGNGIDVFYWKKKKTLTYGHKDNDPFSLGGGATQAIFKDSKQRLWIGTYRDGLQLFNQETENFESFRHNNDAKHSISSNDIRAITEDRHGYLWVCSHGKGVDKFNPELNTFTNFNAANNNLSNDFTIDIKCDAQNNIWVATAWALSVLKAGESAFEIYLNDKNNHNSLSSNAVNTVFVDRKNRIWIGTSNGLNLYNPTNNQFIRYINGFENRNILSITDDEANQIWVGTSNGVSRLNVETGHILNISKADGLASNNMVPRSVYNNGSNTLFFGSINGLTYFNPSELKYKNLNQNVYLTKLKIYNKEVNNHSHTILKEQLMVTDKIKLPYSSKVFTFEFTALNFGNEEKTQYAYFLEGFEKEWNYVGNTREAYYTNLSPGKYVFKVKAANSEGIWSDNETKLQVQITPPFWMTWWFIAFMAILVVGSIIEYIFRRERKLIKDKIILEQKVNERTFEIAKQHDKLAMQKIELEKSNDLKNNFFKILAHDLRNPISNIVQLTNLLQKSLNIELGSKNAKIVNITAQTALETYNLLEELLLWGQAQTNETPFTFENLDLKELVNQSIENISILAKNKQIEIKAHIPGNIQVYADKNALKVILRNLLSNAIKFSNVGDQISIDCEGHEMEIQVCITDFGVGMTQEKVDELSSTKPINSTTGTIGETGKGLGLSFCKNLVYQNNGRIWVESKKNKGARFYFTVPKSNDQNRS
ncbi:MAG: two-component regulator propeller domain-containing protein [Prolixibacteraceae bacterium]